jgi:hypothetical protein
MSKLTSRLSVRIVNVANRRPSADTERGTPDHPGNQRASQSTLPHSGTRGEPAISVTEGSSQQSPSEPAASVGVRTVLGAVVSQTVLVTAVFYYFGWVRAQATFGYFGVQLSLVDYSTSDYVLRSSNTIFSPLVGVIFVVLALLCMHRWLVLPLVAPNMNGHSHRFLDRVLVMAQVVALVLAALVVVGLLMQDQVGRPLGLTLPLSLSLTTAAALLAYVWHVRSLMGTLATDVDQIARDTNRAATRTKSLQSLVLLTLVLIGFWWALAIYADHIGKRIAGNIASGLPTAPEVSLYSVKRIQLTGPGVTVEEIRQDNSRYRYQYRGLRLLARTRDQYLILPAGWQKGRDSVSRVPDDDTVRIDIGSR